MSTFLEPDNEFLRRVIAVTEAHLSDEDFGVSELAAEMSMSRSNLLRKIKDLTGGSVSVYIRQIRLHHARLLLSDGNRLASEVSYAVGFSSISYFTKCFREEFGYTPGEERRMQQESKDEETVAPENARQRSAVFIWVAVSLILIASAVHLFWPEQNDGLGMEKSIAVLPFKNDSSDSTNVYIVNGLMETILSNLQKVGDLDVTSRTTVEKYRHIPRTIPEMSKELGVNYFVEGSGQKIGNRIVLSVQLIEGPTDRHIWSKRYERNADDIFKLQTEVARNIASEIKAVITPEENQRIAKIPTENLEAYDHYLQGIEFTRLETTDGLNKAIEQFRQAIGEDENFAQAYAYVAICYYYLEIFQANKQYGDRINLYADKALLLDDDLAESQFAKGLYFMNTAQYERAVPYFEKALEISPNATSIHNFLSDIYTSYIPDTKEYLRHALRGIRAAVAGQDSITASFSYLHLSNALVQSGFVREAEEYIRKSLALNPDNLYSAYLYAYIKFARHSDLDSTRDELISIWHKDTTRLDILQEVAKLYYTQGNYPDARQYYQRFMHYKAMYDLDIYPGEDLKIAYVQEHLGNQAEADSLYANYKAFIEADESLYHELMWGAWYAAHKEVEQGMQHLKAFTKERGYVYWVVLFMDRDPILQELSGHPEFEETIHAITENFWHEHQETRKMLEEEGVI